MAFTLTTDTSCDAFKTDLDAAGVPWIPLTYTIEGVVHEDNFSSEAQYQGFYDKLATGVMPTTSQINTFTHEEFFEKVLAQNGGKPIVHLTLSGGLSETVNSARVAANIVQERRGADCKIFIVDTLSATQGHRIVLDHALTLQKSGMAADEAAKALDAFTPKVQHWFMVDDLHHLKRGGRVSAASAVIGSLLKIKPILTIDAKGKLAVVKKAKGAAAAINFFMDTIAASKEDVENGAFYIVNANAHKYVEMLKERLNETYPNCPVNCGWIGPVIGAHTGGGTFGVAFVGKDRIAAKE